MQVGCGCDASGQRVRELDLPGFLVPLAAVGGELMSKIDKKPRLFNRQKAKMGAQEAWTCTHQAAREDVGYRPRVPVAEGVSRAFAAGRTSAAGIRKRSGRWKFCEIGSSKRPPSPSRVSFQ